MVPIDGLAGVNRGVPYGTYRWCWEHFLARLYSEGYKYQSLNAYRSAISSAHVDGISVWSHPSDKTPSRCIQFFWDAGMVIQHIKGLDATGFCYWISHHPLAVEFGAFAVEFVALVLQFVASSGDWIRHLCNRIRRFCFRISRVCTRIHHGYNDSKKLTTCHKVNNFLPWRMPPETEEGGG